MAVALVEQDRQMKDSDCLAGKAEESIIP